MIPEEIWKQSIVGLEGYLCSPYSHDNPAVRHMRFVEACLAIAWARNKGIYLFSPIAHSHPIAEICGLPLDAAFWRTYNCRAIASFPSLFVLTIDGWKESIGIKDELREGREQKKKLFMLNKKDNSNYSIMPHDFNAIERMMKDV